MQIAAHLRYLPMGYFSENSLGAITSVTTNTMDNLSGVSTRVVMLVTEGIFSTAVMTLAVFLFIVTNLKKTKKWHPIVFLGFSAVVGIVFGFAGA